MTTTVRDDRPPAPVPAPAGPTVALERRWVARAAVLLLVTAAWNVWVWATRAWNLLTDERSFSVGFVVVHLVLFTVSLTLAVAVARVGLRMRTAAREVSA